jgi:uridine kinase
MRSGGCCSILSVPAALADTPRKRFDLDNDRPFDLEWRQTVPAAALIVDGIFLHRPELRPCWDLSIFLKVDFDVSLPRGAARGENFDAIDPNSPPHLRYVGGQKRYLAECAPEQQADIVIDYNDLEAPRILKWVNA